MKKLLVIPVLVITTAQAGGYLDLGLGLADSRYAYDVTQSCAGGHKNYGYMWECSIVDKPLHGVVGTVELGYTMGDYTAYLSHTSIINRDDGPGLNILGVKKRFNLF